MSRPRYSVDTVQAIARKHGWGCAAIEPMPRLGIVNDVWALGDEAVLRIPLGPEEESDALTESVAVPLIRSYGVLTPELLVFDTDRDLVPYAYTIYRRAAGLTLGTLPPGPQWSLCYEEIGEQQRILASIESVEDPNGWLDQYETIDIEQELADARPNWPPEEEHRWRQWMDFLADVSPAPTEFCLLHWDLHPWNVLVDPDSLRLSAILDWGDAGFHDPAVDFAHARISTIAPQLRGFGGLPSPEFAGRITQAALIWILCEMQDLDSKFRRDWWLYPSGGMLDVAEALRSLPGFEQWVPELK